MARRVPLAATLDRAGRESVCRVAESRSRDRLSNQRARGGPRTFLARRMVQSAHVLSTSPTQLFRAQRPRPSSGDDRAQSLEQAEWTDDLLQALAGARTHLRPRPATTTPFAQIQSRV